MKPVAVLGGQWSIAQRNWSGWAGRLQSSEYTGVYLGLWTMWCKVITGNEGVQI